MSGARKGGNISFIRLIFYLLHFVELFPREKSCDSVGPSPGAAHGSCDLSELRFPHSPSLHYAPGRIPGFKAEHGGGAQRSADYPGLRSPHQRAEAPHDNGAMRSTVALQGVAGALRYPPALRVGG